MYAIEAYAYQGELLCPDCALDAADDRYGVKGEDADWQTLEDVAGRACGGPGFVTTDDFPFPCQIDDVQLGDTCGNCGEYLVDGIPEGAADVDSDIASDWHGGQWTALYSLASTGRVNGFQHRLDLLAEIDSLWDRPHPAATAEDMDRLRWLRYQVDQWPTEAV